MLGAALGSCGIVAALVAVSAVTAMRHTGQLCAGRWCWQSPTRVYQDGPNAVQYPTHHFCDRCYERFVAERRELHLHIDPRAGKIVIGNQLFEQGRRQASRAGVYDLRTDWAQHCEPSPGDQASPQVADNSRALHHD